MNKTYLFALFACAALSACTAQSDYDLTLYSVMSANPNFQSWLAEAEEATGLKIRVIAAPTDTHSRMQKITTMLSTGDTDIDVLEIDDEMSASFKNTGWLDPLEGTVITDEIYSQLAQGYVDDMITSKEGHIIGLPGYQGYLSFWVNQQIMDELGFTSIDTLDDFIAFARAATGNGRWGYGGAWERTYVFNELAAFVNLFGGDYFDWSRNENREALQFMYDMVNTWKVTPMEQIAEQYPQLNQKFIDGKVAMIFMWGAGTDYAQAGMLGPDKLHIAQMPLFRTRSVFSDSWSYVLNSASKKKEAALVFLRYMASTEGMLSSWEWLDRYPARRDAAALIEADNLIKQAYERYADTAVIRGRPMLSATMEFISEIGSLFHNYIQNRISIDKFLVRAQAAVEQYR